MSERDPEYGPLAHEGCVWLCIHDGKTSPYKYPGPLSSPGYDESCMLNAVHVRKDPTLRPDGGRHWEHVPHPDDHLGAQMMKRLEPPEPEPPGAA